MVPSSAAASTLLPDWGRVGGSGRSGPASACGVGPRAARRRLLASSSLPLGLTLARSPSRCPGGSHGCFPRAMLCRACLPAAVLLPVHLLAVPRALRADQAPHLRQKMMGTPSLSAMATECPLLAASSARASVPRPEHLPRVPVGSSWAPTAQHRHLVQRQAPSRNFHECCASGGTECRGAPTRLAAAGGGLLARGGHALRASAANLTIASASARLVSSIAASAGDCCACRCTASFASPSAWWLPIACCRCSTS